jgi:hypothetical protein
MNFADPQAHTMAVLDQVLDERARQDEKWGPPNPSCPDGTGASHFVDEVEHIRHACQFAADHGGLTFRHILAEEVAEAFAEDDPARLRAELVQVSAVAVKWIEAIDRRTP